MYGLIDKSNFSNQNFLKSLLYYYIKLTIDNHLNIRLRISVRQGESVYRKLIVSNNTGKSLLQ